MINTSGSAWHLVRDDDTCANWRRNGQTKRWKRNPERWQIPIKFGLSRYGILNEEYTEARWHDADKCPKLQTEKDA